MDLEPLSNSVKDYLSNNLPTPSIKTASVNDATSSNSGVFEGPVFYPPSPLHSLATIPESIPVHNYSADDFGDPPSSVDDFDTLPDTAIDDF